MNERPEAIHVTDSCYLGGPDGFTVDGEAVLDEEWSTFGCDSTLDGGSSRRRRAATRSSRAL